MIAPYVRIDVACGKRGKTKLGGNQKRKTRESSDRKIEAQETLFSFMACYPFIYASVTVISRSRPVFFPGL
jgi:hypothetical protein